MIIGLTGYATSGKDTVAKTLVERYGYKRVAFADAIRDLLYAVEPMIDNLYSLRLLVDTYGWDEVKKRPEVRRLLQNLGVGGRAVLGEWVWLKIVADQIHFEGKYVITDVRFKNEAKFIKEYDNAELWRVTRGGVSAVNSHITEHDLDDYPVDAVVNNGGTIDELELLVHKTMEYALRAK